MDSNTGTLHFDPDHEIYPNFDPDHENFPQLDPGLDPSLFTHLSILKNVKTFRSFDALQV